MTSKYNLILVNLEEDGSAHYFPWVWDENKDDDDGDYGVEITAEEAFREFCNGCKAEIGIPAAREEKYSHTSQKTKSNSLKFNKQKTF